MNPSTFAPFRSWGVLKKEGFTRASELYLLRTPPLPMCILTLQARPSPGLGLSSPPLLLSLGARLGLVRSPLASLPSLSSRSPLGVWGSGGAGRLGFDAGHNCLVVVMVVESNADGIVAQVSTLLFECFLVVKSIIILLVIVVVAHDPIAS